jgi:hypothetical protein
MPVMAIEINDAGIVAVGEAAPGTALAPASPGYALLDGDRLLTGLEAAAAARLKPRFVHDRFWCDLDTAPIGRPFPDHVTTGDLGHAHLSDVWRRVGTGADSVVLAVPGSHDERQLGLILGVARAAGVPVSGLVDAAVAASAGGVPGEDLLHVDLQRHRAVVTELRQRGEIVRGRVEVVERPGLAALHDTWLRYIAGLFVRKTRFDPLHAASTEQELFARLPGWLDDLRAGETAVATLTAGGRDYSVDLTRGQVVAAVDDDYGRIVQLVSLTRSAGGTTTVLLSHRVASLPGLEARLAAIAGVETVRLSPEAAASGALRHAPRSRTADEEIPFVVRLPLSDAVTPPPPVAAPRSREVSRTGSPTHVLHDGAAYELREDRFVLGTAVPDSDRGLSLTGAIAGISRSHCSLFRVGDDVVVEDHSTHGSFVNDQPVRGRTLLATGDRLRLGTPGIELRLIAVVKDDGAPRH